MTLDKAIGELIITATRLFEMKDHFPSHSEHRVILQGEVSRLNQVIAALVNKTSAKGTDA